MNAVNTPESKSWWARARTWVVVTLAVLGAAVWVLLSKGEQRGRQLERDEIAGELDQVEAAAKKHKEDVHEKLENELGEIARDPDSARRDERVEDWLGQGVK